MTTWRTYLQLSKFMRFVTRVFRVNQLGEKELFEFRTVPEHGRVGQRWSEEWYIVSGGHADLIPVYDAENSNYYYNT